MLDQRLFLFFLLIGTVNCDTYSPPCPSLGPVAAVCSATIAYLFDVSIDLPGTQVFGEFDFIRNSILPGTNWNQSAYMVFETYGSDYGYPYEPTNVLAGACENLYSLEDLYKTYYPGYHSLYEGLEWLDDHYKVTDVVILSADQMQQDIINAGIYANFYMPSVKFTVVALNGAPFDEDNFPGTIYHVNNITNPPENLGWCLINSACGIDPGCNIDERKNPPGKPTTPSTVLPTAVTTPSTSTTRAARITTAPPAIPGTPSTTSTTRSTPTSTTIRNPTTSNPDSSSSNLQCECDTMSAWLDIIFVIDASASTGEMGLDEMWGMAATMLDLFNVQKTGYTASNYTSRVGIITYGNKANVLYPLGSLDNTDIDNLFDLPFNNDQMTNLEAGLQAAVSEFNSPNHRSNAKPVIIVMAAAFDPIGTNAPNKTAATIKEDGGIIMVFNYIPENGVESPTLATIASPGYFFSTTFNSRYTDLALGLCDANCFCRDMLHSYGLSNPRQYPTKGCYIGITADNNYARAVNNCKSHYYGGTVTTDEDSMKTVFLKTLFPSSNAFYIGLSYDTFNRRWEWADGTTPGSYQPWAGGRVPDGSSQQCVYLDSSSQWQAVDCRTGFPYVCEIRPCDSTHYCA